MGAILGMIPVKIPANYTGYVSFLPGGPSFHKHL
jgi:hypothetical protein